MSLIAAIQKYVPLGRRSPLPRGETLALRPIRNSAVTWETPENEDDAVGLRLLVPRRSDAVGRWLGRWLAYPAHKIIELDEFGADLWQRCDGAHTVTRLVDHTASAHKLNRRQAEVSVVAFLKMLAQRRLIGFAAPDPRPTTAPKGAKTHGTVRPQRAPRDRRAAWRRH